MSFETVVASEDATPYFLSSGFPPEPLKRHSRRFRVAKRAVDLGTGVLALPIVGGIALALLVVNPVVNPGPVFFRHERMGFGGRRFMLWKFRTMTEEKNLVRGANDPVEDHRVTPLGRIMRRLRIDELPNFINVLKGDMCLVGPRPDAWEHAKAYIGTVPYYHERFRAKPGITGLAQVRGGYADNPRAVQRKARFDHFYVSRSNSRLELFVLSSTVAVILNGFGAK